MDYRDPTHLDRLPNLRDVGGKPAAGGTIVTGQVYRTGGPAVMAAADVVAELKRLGIRTLCDLRSDGERATAPWPDGFDVVALPIPEAEPSEAIRLPLYDATDLGRMYIGMAERMAPQLVAEFTVLADPARRPAIINCSAGKDRTGISVALLLGLLGVERSLIVADYAATNANMDEIIARLASVGEFGGAEIDLSMIPRAILEAPAAAIEMFLDELDAHYSGAAGFLKVKGLPEHTIEALRSQLIA